MSLSTHTPLFDPTDFRIEPGVTHVCAGGESPFLRSHDEAMLRYAHDKSIGMPGREAQEATALRARTLAAKFLQVNCAQIGFVSNVAEGVSIVAESIDWRPGDNVCFDVIEYPSVVMPFARIAASRGVELRLASPEHPMAELVDQHTRLIGTSHVSYLDGSRNDLAALRSIADGSGAQLLVDYSQSAGTLPIDASIADFAFSACYKWLLGSTGVALAYWNQARQPDWHPSTAGWYSIDTRGTQPAYAERIALREDALRFTRGNPAFIPVYVLANALEYLGQFEMATVESHIAALAGRLIEGLDELGLNVSTPGDPARRGASVCFNTADASAVVEKLSQQGVLAWSGRGRVRFSFHGYNCGADIGAILRAMRQVLDH